MQTVTGREALAGEPGEYVAIVRKAKDKYFLGAATDEEARSIDVKLDFLEKGKTYAAVIYADGKDADWGDQSGILRNHRETGDVR